MGSCSTKPMPTPTPTYVSVVDQELMKEFGTNLEEAKIKATEARVVRAKESFINKEVATEFGKIFKTVMSDPVEADVYADAVGMDANNRRVLQAFATGGKDAGFKALFTAPDGKRTLSYAESRALYG